MRIYFFRFVAKSHDNRSNGGIYKIQATSAEVFLGDFKGFGVRGYEIRLIVYRVAECEQSLKSVKKTNALYLQRP